MNLGGGVINRHGADDSAFPQEVPWCKLAEDVFRAGQHVSAGCGVEMAEPEPVRARAAGQLLER